MSHFTEMQSVSFKVLQEKALVAALHAVFGEGSVEVYEHGSALTGYDSGYGAKAHVIVRRDKISAVLGHAYNDMGFTRQGDGSYRLHVDPTDVDETALNKIKQQYTTAVSINQLAKQGYIKTKQVAKNGTIEIVMVKY